MVTVSPKRLSGPWKAGYALDLHTLSSNLVGYDEWGHEVFDTKRSDMGDLLYRLKYQSDKVTIPVIVETAVEFIRAQAWEIDLVVPVPPSNRRAFQPVLALAESVAKTLGIPYCGDCVVKVHETPQLKNLYDLSERSRVLKDAFTVSKTAMVKKNVLLFDDLYRSGATLQAVASALVENAGIQDLYVLTLTMTRTRR
ncbi:MAG: ComF family protein [Chloroflexi bacterium]|nr:ComF family protein [Chloroflexota bacterium]